MNIIKLSIIAFNVIGGLGLFLYGLKLLSNNLQKISSEKLQSLLDFLTKNKFMGLISGALITAVLQSSSATSILLIGFANAGIIGLTQCISIIFGTNIGITITAQIIAFKAGHIALPLIGTGAILFLFSKNNKVRSAGEILIGLGMIFFGLKIIGDFLKPFKGNLAFIRFMSTFGTYPLLGVLAGAVITAIIQSSSAATGMIITLSAIGALDFQSAFCLILGTNTGTAIPVQIAAIGTNVTARRVAVSHAVFNTASSFYMLLLLYIPYKGQPVFLQLVDFLTPGSVFSGENTARHIANAHTLFNMMNVIILFPFIDHLARIAGFIIPGREKEPLKIVKYLDERMVKTPSIALKQVSKETVRMMEIAKNMNLFLYKVIYKNKKAAVHEVTEREEILNSLQNRIINFIVNLEQSLFTEKEKNEATVLIQIIERLERIGDHNSSILFHYTKLREFKENLNKESINDFKYMSHNLQDMFQYLITGFQGNNPAALENLERHYESTVAMENIIRQKNIDLLKKRKLSPGISIQFMEIINHIERINDHLLKISRYISDTT
ncbi:MAG: Na/Pi cotransporter family protein [bacterium]|nr:Na/Pi cotransporter family protein [bacterium]